MNDLRSASLHRILVKKNSASVSRNRRTIVNSEDRVFSEAEIEQQSTSMTIFRDVCDAKLPPNARAEGFEIASFEVDVARDACGIDQSGQCLDQLSLTVTFHPGDTNDLTATNFE